MKQITLPLESNIIISKNGHTAVEHTALVTGNVGQEFSEAAVQLMGGSVDEVVRELDQDKPTLETS